MENKREESDDYDGHSVSMLNKIAKALNKKINISIVPENNEKVRFVFQEVA
jgi:hypothetical protein